MDKFGRSYHLEVAGADYAKTGQTLKVEPPFTLEFDVVRNTLPSLNVCQIRILNLAERNRSNLLFNNYNFSDFRPLILKAGYGINLPIIFIGNVQECWSVREGNNFVTQIENYDGGYACINGQVALTFPENTPWQAVIAQVAAALEPTVHVGAISTFPGNISKSLAANGNAMEWIRTHTGATPFIDNGKLNVIFNDEFLAAENGIQVINAKSGLLGTPLLEQYIVHVNMVFEPKLVPGQKIVLESSGNKIFNGIYKVTGVKHRGTISEAVCGDVITTVMLQRPASLRGVI